MFMHQYVLLMTVACRLLLSMLCNIIVSNLFPLQKRYVMASWINFSFLSLSLSLPPLSLSLLSQLDICSYINIYIYIIQLQSENDQGGKRYSQTYLLWGKHTKWRHPPVFLVLWCHQFVSSTSPCSVAQAGTEVLQLLLTAKNICRTLFAQA